MSKYIIEIAEEYEEYFKGVLICGIADGKFAVDVIAREDLEELNSDYINEHYGQMQDEAYLRGFKDGKNQKEDGEDSIDVGDEVVFEKEGAEPFVILYKYYDDAGYPSEYMYFAYAQSGEVLIFNERNRPKKTGRHFQEINKLLEAMRA